MLAPSGGVQSHWKNIWKPKVPSKVSFFLWLTSMGEHSNSREYKEAKYYLD